MFKFTQWLLPSIHFTKMAFRLFEDDDHAKLYSKFRPTYPKDLIDFVVAFCKEKMQQSTKSPSSLLAIDIGCGPGQSTRLFANHFDQVIGFDISEAQIKEVGYDKGTDL